MCLLPALGWVSAPHCRPWQLLKKPSFQFTSPCLPTLAPRNWTMILRPHVASFQRSKTDWLSEGMCLGVTLEIAAIGPECSEMI